MQQTEFERTGNLEAYWRFSELCDRERNEGAIRGSIGRAREYQEPSCYDMLTTPQRPRVSLATRFEMDRIRSKKGIPELAYDAQKREIFIPVNAVDEVCPEEIPARIRLGVNKGYRFGPFLHSLPEERPRLSAKDIIRAVALQYNLHHDDIISQRRTRMIVEPRQEAMFFTWALTTLSLPMIGRAFGWRDHTTVLHGVRKYCDKYGLDYNNRLAIRQFAEEKYKLMDRAFYVPEPPMDYTWLYRVAAE